MSNIITSRIASSNGQFIEPQSLLQCLSDRLDINEFENIQSDDKKMTFRSGSSTFAVTLIDSPISWSELQKPCATAWFWPEAALELQRHSHHFIAGILDDTMNAIEGNLKLTHLTAAIAENKDASPVGVLWSTGLVHRPNDFVDHSREASRSALPLELWIAFLPEGSAESVFMMTTVGMEAFGLKELEAAVTGKNPEWVYHRLFNFAHFYLDNPDKLHEGETIGMTENEKAVIGAAYSRFDPNKKVWMLDFQQEESEQQEQQKQIIQQLQGPQG